MIPNVPRIPQGENFRADIAEIYRQVAMMRDNLEQILNKMNERLDKLEQEGTNSGKK